MTKVHSLQLSCWRLWPQSSSWARVFMLLRKRVRKLVGVVTLSDLVGSSLIVIESNYSGIFHCREVGYIEQVTRTSILCLGDCHVFDLFKSYSFILSYKYTFFIKEKFRMRA